jgi:hypothetical protein
MILLPIESTEANSPDLLRLGLSHDIRNEVYFIEVFVTLQDLSDRKVGLRSHVMAATDFLDGIQRSDSERRKGPCH